ncbi:hypothetical protein NDU88_006816 [Pleurodeles waltl]|uniref:Uncharacterized protein n=1 Tax=Pleurodeles waltl TaxID=8319 RepID=A0AAV7PM05_PLEWA|nr:hypothetical protein NDU88_006816 [Pleurodeles waltl]
MIILGAEPRWRRGRTLLDELRNGLRQNILYNTFLPLRDTPIRREGLSLPPPFLVGVPGWSAVEPLVRSSEAVKETRRAQMWRLPHREKGGRGWGAPGERSSWNRTRARRSPCLGSPEEPGAGARAVEERRREYTLDGGKDGVRARGRRDPLRGPPRALETGRLANPGRNAAGGRGDRVRSLCPLLRLCAWRRRGHRGPRKKRRRRAGRGEDTTDSEGNRSAGAQMRSGNEAMDWLTSGDRLDLGGGVRHPLLEAIDNMEAEREARRSRSPEG